MRKYVSLGAAMMVGAVIAREKKSPALQKIHRVPMEYEVTEAFKKAHLERPTVIPKNVIEVEHRFDSIETSTSPNVQFSRDSIDTSRSSKVLNPSRERSQRQIKRKESPNAPNVKQYWFCGGQLFFPYG